VLSQTIVSGVYADDTTLRVHLLAFTFIPLIISSVIYAANGKYKIDYVDTLLLSVSCFTNTGLSPIDISRMTPFQQALLEVQMLSGSIIVVSWIMAYVRM
jgi:Trk-type K+ transport system membrane component